MSGLLRPHWRTAPLGHRHFTLLRVAGVFAITWLAPALIGGVWIGIFFGLSHVVLPAQEALESIGTVGSLLLLSPLVSFYILPFALLAAGWAMRLGWGGSLVAALGGLVLPGLLGMLYQLWDPTAAAIGAMLVLTPVVFVHAMVLWLTCRMLVPEAFAGPKSASPASAGN